jgi:hypothetical protein
MRKTIENHATDSLILSRWREMLSFAGRLEDDNRVDHEESFNSANSLNSEAKIDSMALLDAEGPSELEDLYEPTISDLLINNIE